VADPLTEADGGLHAPGPEVHGSDSLDFGGGDGTRLRWGGREALGLSPFLVQGGESGGAPGQPTGAHVGA
jgi:hypothetical protein